MPCRILPPLTVPIDEPRRGTPNHRTYSAYSSQSTRRTAPGRAVPRHSTGQPEPSLIRQTRHPATSPLEPSDMPRPPKPTDKPTRPISQSEATGLANPSGMPHQAPPCSNRPAKPRLLEPKRQPLPVLPMPHDMPPPVLSHQATCHAAPSRPAARPVAPTLSTLHARPALVDYPRRPRPALAAPNLPKRHATPSPA